MATIDNGYQLELPEADPDEQIDIFSYVVTKAGWETLKSRLKISPSHRVQVLTQLISSPASKLINQSKAEWRYLPSNHAKAIIYRKKKVAVLGSFNLTKLSLGSNIECFHLVDDPSHYKQLADTFNRHWATAKQDKAAFATQEKVWVATIDQEEDETGHEAPRRQAEPTDGPRKSWPFQEDIIQQVMAWLANGRDADLGRIVTLPTGAGKTLVAAEVIRRLLEKKPQARILWVCHRVELLRQSVEMIRGQINGAIPEAGWFVPKNIQDKPIDESTTRAPKQFTLSKDCQMVFCTQQRLRRLISHNGNNRFDLTVVDECHRFHPHSKWYKKLFKYCNDRGIPRLGLTATPLFSPEKRGFGKYWAEAMYGANIKKDHLERIRILSRLNRDLSTHWSTGYEFVITLPHPTRESSESYLMQQVKQFDNPTVNKEVEKAWLKYRGHRQRILCFAVTIAHADELKGKYFTHDNCVQVIHSEFEETVNRTRLKWFMEPASESRMLISVLMLTEGIDLPKTDCLFMVRPTFSKELYEQMKGRGLRGPAAKGTEDCAIVDFTSQFVGPNRQELPFKQVMTRGESDEMEEANRVEFEEDEETDDGDASGRIKTVKDLRRAVNVLRESKEMSIQEACEELAPELDYTTDTLNNYFQTKPDDYLLEPEDEDGENANQSVNGITGSSLGSEASILEGEIHDALVDGQAPLKRYVTSNKLLDLRACAPQRFEEIASLTSVASSTLRSYCSDQENFRRWRANNRDKMDHVLLILAESLSRDSDAA